MNFTVGDGSLHHRPVRMGEMAVSKTAADVLTVVGLGSCVALVLLSPSKKAAGLAHVVLPEARMTGGREAPAGKFADTAVAALVKEFGRLRVKPDELRAVVIGGAMMFGHKAGSKLAGVGDRNVEAVLDQLDKVGIPVIGTDVGGRHGRSVTVHVGEALVSSKSGMDDPIEFHPEKVDANKNSSGRAKPAPEPFPDDIWTRTKKNPLRA